VKQNKNKPTSNPPRLRWIYVLWMTILVALVIPGLISNLKPVKEISWKEFEQKILQRKAVEKIDVINNQTAEIYVRKEFKDDPYFKEVMHPIFGKINHSGPHYYFNIGTVEAFENKLEKAQAGFTEEDKPIVEFVNRRNWLADLIPWLIPLVLLFFLWRYFFRTIRGGGTGNGASIFNFGKSTAKLMEHDNRSKVTFDDVAGLEEAKAEVKEIVDFLKFPKTYTDLGAKIPKGVIIVGPPGTGKTLLVKAVAGEAQVPFFSISGSEFVEMFVGVGASRVRDLFAKAKEKAPSIIFIDEIDAVGRSRGRDAFYTGANDERESTLNQLLTEMDGFSTNSGVIVLAATNRADLLDPALLRPGRFDRHIYLELPTQNERVAIFRVHLKPLVLDDAIHPDYLAAQTPGCSGADIANICNEAALIAARRKKTKIDKQDFMEAIDRTIAGVEKRSKIIAPEEKKIIAYHEAGHAIASWMLEQVDPLVKVSIVPRGKSLGAAWYLPEEHQLRSKAQFTEMICAALGGRAAEDLVFGDVTSGALDDLEKVTKQAYTMVAFYGFDKKVGNISFYDSTGQSGSSFKNPYSEETARLIDEQVRNLVETSYQRTKDILVQNRAALDELAEMLLKKEVVMKEDIEKILGKRAE